MNYTNSRVYMYVMWPRGICTGYGIHRQLWQRT